MKLIEKSIVIVFIYIVTLFSMQIFATDAEGDQQRFDVIESFDANDEVKAISVTMAIKRTEDVSFELRFASRLLSGNAMVFSAARFSKAGNLIIKDNSGWIDKDTEDLTEVLDYKRAEFDTGVEYLLKMKYYLNDDEICWYLDDVFLCKTTARLLADEINMEKFFVVLRCLGADKDKIQCALKSVVHEGDGSFVVENVYSPSYSAVQGTDNWNLCEFCGTECNNLTQYLDENKWKSEYESSLYINMSNGNISPSKDTGVGFKFTAPVTGVIRISGMIENLGNRVVPVKIYKDTAEVWSSEVNFGYSVGYYRIIPIEKGEKIYFEVCADQKYSDNLISWTPTVEYIDVDYPSDAWYSYWQRHDGEYTALTYDQSTEKYCASDNNAYISHNIVNPTQDYSIVKRHVAQENGRYRIYGSFASSDADMEVSVLKNSMVIWKQLILAGEPSILDIRALLNAGDVVDVEFTALNTTAPNCTLEDLYIGVYFTAPFVKASGSVGDNYNVISQTSLSDLITNPGDTKVRFYSKRFSRELPMTVSGDRWVSSVENDSGYFSASKVFPGNHYDSVMEITVNESGILHIDGDMRVRENSDGVISKILLNDETVWSSRVGEERPVRWDEPYDVSYFSNNISVTLNVKKGDKLCFSFNQWRLTDNDTVDISNVMLKYIEGDLFSDTTKWKLNNSIVIDTQKHTVKKGETEYDADILINNGVIYINFADASKVFASNILADTEIINGQPYLPVRANAEQNGDTVVWAAERLAIIHSGIPVLYGWSELSEINAYYAISETEFVNRLNDTYEDGTQPSVSLNNSNATLDNKGGLKPQLGHTDITKQSNALVLEYFGYDNILSNTSIINIYDYVCDKVNVIESDIFIPAHSNFAFEACDSTGAACAQILISENGWIAPYFGDDDIDGRFNLSIEDAISDTTYSASEFTFGTWNNIKLVNDRENQSFCIYLNNNRVGENIRVSTSYDVSTFKIVNYSAVIGKTIPLYIDNLKLRTANSFISERNLTEDSLSMLTDEFNDTFEEGDNQATIISWSGDNQLKPIGGKTTVVKQSNAARVYAGTDGNNVDNIRFDVRDYIGDNSFAVIVDFDINLFKDDIVLLSERSYSNYGAQAIISPKGYIASAYGLENDSPEQQDIIREYANQDMISQVAVPFKRNQWHNIKMLYEDGGKRCTLYVDGKPVNVENRAEETPFEVFQISILSSESNRVGNAIFDIDNLKISRINVFDISDVYFQNQSGEKIEVFIPGDDCYVSFRAQNKDITEKDITLVVAQYLSDGRQLSNVSTHKLKVSGNDGKVDINSSSVDNAIKFKTNEDVERITIFVWDGLDNLTPLIDAVSIFQKKD